MADLRKEVFVTGGLNKTIQPIPYRALKKPCFYRIILFTMATLTTIPSLIALDSSGVAWISGANTKVLEVAMDAVAHGWSPEEIAYQHPHLSLAMVHSALAHFFAHREEYEKQMELSVQNASALREDSLARSAVRRRISEKEKTGEK
jgi:uncharacterized protein (DUF433 family)